MSYFNYFNNRNHPRRMIKYLHYKQQIWIQRSLAENRPDSKQEKYVSITVKTSHFEKSVSYY